MFLHGLNQGLQQAVGSHRPRPGFHHRGDGFTGGRPPTPGRVAGPATTASQSTTAVSVHSAANVRFRASPADSPVLHAGGLRRVASATALWGWGGPSTGSSQAFRPAIPVKWPFSARRIQWPSHFRRLVRRAAADVSPRGYNHRRNQFISKSTLPICQPRLALWSLI